MLEASTNPPRPDAAALTLDQLREAWRRSVLPAVEQRSIPIGKTLAEAHPSILVDDALTIEFPEQAAFHLRLVEDPKYVAMLRDALFEVTGRKLAISFVVGASRTEEPANEAPATEADLLELMKSTFDATELEK